MAPMLSLESISVHYGAICALRDVSIEVNAGEIVTLIGSNGAGKSTTLRAVSALRRPSSGRISFEGKDLAGKKPHEVLRMGLAQVPEGRGIFPNLTVDENLDLGAFARKDGGEVAKDRGRVFTLFPRLKERLKQRAGTHSGGEQQMLAIGRALMGNPRVLLMDEPSEGLAPQIVAEVGRTIAQLKSEGLSIVLVEQNVKLTLDLADDVVIINTGAVVFQGTAAETKNNQALIAQHLGVF